MPAQHKAGGGASWGGAAEKKPHMLFDHRLQSCEESSKPQTWKFDFVKMFGTNVQGLSYKCPRYLKGLSSFNEHKSAPKDTESCQQPHTTTTLNRSRPAKRPPFETNFPEHDLSSGTKPAKRCRSNTTGRPKSPVN